MIGEVWDIDSFLKEMPIKPTESYKLGDEYVLSNQKLRHRIETVWNLTIEHKTVHDHHYEEIYHPIFKALDQQAKTIIKYKELYNLTCLISIRCDYHKVQTPGIRLDSSIINFANKVGAIIDIYIYND